VTDPEKQIVDVTAAIDGKTSTTSVDTNSTNAWTLTWNIDGLGIAAGTYSNIPFDADDNNGGTASATYTGSITIDTTAPETIITGSPAPLTNSDSASFSFSSEFGATFEVSIDGGSFSAATTPKNYTGLLEGPHTFSVRAVDAAGNIDTTPTSYTWIIDTTAPDTTITDIPAAITSSASASFSFSSEIGATFEVSLDGGPYSTVISPKDYTDLSEGSHTFLVRAVDAAGNKDATPASYTWTIDTTAPETTINDTPTAFTSFTTATFSFSSQIGSTFEVSIDGGAYIPGASPITYSLPDGMHTFAVRATDPAGNIDTTPASYTWTIDTIAPTVVIPAGGLSLIHI
jgi:hypothetical protein